MDRQPNRHQEKLQVGELHKVVVDGLTHDGEGVGHLKKLAVFVPEGIPGDEVLIRIISTKKNYARGLIEEIIKPSPQRIQPVCLLAGECGGCQLQHMNYQSQLYWKVRQVEDAIGRIAKLTVPIRGIIGMEQPFEYRNKAQFPLGMIDNQLVMGFFRKRTHDIVDLDQCKIQHSLTMKLSLAIKTIMQELNILPYDERTKQGDMRHVVSRISFTRSELMVVFVTNSRRIPAEQELIRELTKQVPELISIAHNINNRTTNAIFGPKTKILWGEPYLVDQIGGLKFAISPRSFFQVNPIQTKVLYEQVKEGAALTGAETIWDLYCGIGTIGLYLADMAKAVYGVEVIPEAVDDGNYNANLNGIRHASFHCGKAEDVVPRLVKQGAHVDVVLLDPPRKGCDPALLATIARLQVPKLVYVSCNPSSLARDLLYLTAQGYRVDYIQPVDMFPMTSHVECVVVLNS